MRTIKKCIAGLLMMSIIGLYMPNDALCGGTDRVADVPNKTVTRHKVRAMSAPEDIPVEKVKGGGKKVMKWLLIGAGAALAVGVVAAGGGGSSSGSSSQGTSTVSSPGVKFGW